MTVFIRRRINQYCNTYRVFCNHFYWYTSTGIGNRFLFDHLNFELFCFVAAQPLLVNGWFGIQIMTHIVMFCVRLKFSTIWFLHDPCFFKKYWTTRAVVCINVLMVCIYILCVCLHPLTGPLAPDWRDEWLKAWCGESGRESWLWPIVAPAEAPPLGPRWRLKWSVIGQIDFHEQLSVMIRQMLTHAITVCSLSSFQHHSSLFKN